MGVMPEIAQAVEEMDWSLPTDIQAESIPMILGGGDVLMAAETGSGKTGAFCLPIIQIVYETLKDVQEGKGSKSVADGKSASAGTSSSKWKMNIFDRDDAIAIDTEEGLLCQSRDQQKWNGTRSNKGVSGKGKYYYEATVTDEGLCRVGWSTLKSTTDLGTDKEGFGFGGTGKKSFGKQFDNYGEAFGLSDVIGSYLDLDNGSIKWSKNGVDFGKAFDIPDHLRRCGLFAAVCLKYRWISNVDGKYVAVSEITPGQSNFVNYASIHPRGTSQLITSFGLENAELRFNFGDTPFKFPPKGDYIALCGAPKECVVASSLGASASKGQKAANPNAPYAIIMEPSRELAEQTLVQVQKFKKHLTGIGIRELLVVGGVGVKEQVDALFSGVDIVVGTPGRMEDLISTGKLDLSSCRFFVLDECDGLLSGGYGDLINRIHKQIPKVTPDGKRLQMVVCSATLHSVDVRRMADKLMHFPTWIDLKGQDSVPDTVHHVVLMVDPKVDQLWKTVQQHIHTDGVHAKDRLNPTIETPEMLSEAVKILKGEYTLRAIIKLKMDKAIIFCRTKVDCDNMEDYLLKAGGGARNKSNPYYCVCLHSDRKPHERKENLEKFKRGDVKFLICTDVAARGIDVSGLPFVINVTLPDEKQNYVHRIGRVGRAERMGLAISFAATLKEKVWYHSNCTNKGKDCYNTRLTDEGGCCIWYNEPNMFFTHRLRVADGLPWWSPSQYLAEIEEHLGVTIDQVDTSIEIATNEFDGKVTYGQKRSSAGSGYKGHVETLAPAVKELAQLEKRAQSSYLNLLYNKPFLSRK